MGRLKEAYEKVFDEHGNIKVCGRNACINLIEECKKEEFWTNFGDAETGVMNVRAIQRLYKMKCQNEGED